VALRKDDIQSIDEDLEELEHNITRLRLEYEQYFRGVMKREPFALKGKVQKIITQYLTKPPRSSTHKFRFNSLNARFQSLRNMWGRTMREIESGTYRPHKFLAKAADAASQEAAMREASKAEREAGAAPTRAAAPAAAAQGPASTLGRLHSALMSARQKTGESVADLTEEKLARLVKQQTQALRERHGDSAKIKFKIVVEDNKAKLKATVS
jgi:hypothetical protein